MNIKFNVVGKIVDGEYLGWYVKFIQDVEDGSILIIQSISKDFIEGEEGYDNWVENIDSLEQYITESDWKIYWLTDLRELEINER
jgi:hypothetical protein